MFAFTAAGLLTLCLRCVHGVVGFLAASCMALMSAVFSTSRVLHATMLFVRASATQSPSFFLFAPLSGLATPQAAASLQLGAELVPQVLSAHDHTHCGSRCVPPHGDDHRVSASRCVARSRPHLTSPHRFSRYCGAYHPFQGTAPPGVVLSVASQTNNVSRLAGFKVRPSSIRVRQQP